MNQQIQHPAFQAFAVVAQELSPLRKPSSPTRSNRNKGTNPESPPFDSDASFWT
jgi:hypothetical protein